MASNNHVFLAGNVVQPPYFNRVGERQRPYLRLYLAVDRPGRDRGTDFVRVVAYDEVALWYPHLEPGTGVAVLPGRMQTRKIKRRGERDTVVEVVAGGFTPLARIDWRAGDAFREEILEPGQRWDEGPVNNFAFLMGNLTREPHYDRIPRQERPPLPFLCVYVAVDRPAAGADFVRVVAYGDLAQLSWPYLQAGSGVACTGRIQVRKFAQNGRQKTAVEVVADNVKFLSRINWEEGDRVRDQILADRAQAGV